MLAVPPPKHVLPSGVNLIVSVKRRITLEYKKSVLHLVFLFANDALLSRQHKNHATQFTG